MKAFKVRIFANDPIIALFRDEWFTLHSDLSLEEFSKQLAMQGFRAKSNEWIMPASIISVEEL